MCKKLNDDELKEIKLKLNEINEERYNKDNIDFADPVKANRWCELSRQANELEEILSTQPPPNIFKVTRIHSTCLACPSVWEGVTEEGYAIYVRYRGGYLYICVGNEDKPIYEFGKQIDIQPESEDDKFGHAESAKMMRLVNGGIVSFDGYLNPEKLINNTQGYFSWPLNLPDDYA